MRFAYLGLVSVLSSSVAFATEPRKDAPKKLSAEEVESLLEKRNNARDAALDAEAAPVREQLRRDADKADAELRRRVAADADVPQQWEADRGRAALQKPRIASAVLAGVGLASVAAGWYFFSVASADRSAILAGGYPTGAAINSELSALQTASLESYMTLGLGGILALVGAGYFVWTFLEDPRSAAPKQTGALQFEGGALRW